MKKSIKLASEITENIVYNKNGKVYENDVWATADIKKLPEKWVVEKDENNPLWEVFCENFANEEYSEKLLYNESFFGNIYSENSLEKLEGHQYLTLEQWAEFCLPKKENMIFSDVDKSIGDLGLYFSDIEDEIEQLMKGNITIGKITNIYDRWWFFYKLDMNKPIPPQINEFIEMYKNK